MIQTGAVKAGFPSKVAATARRTYGMAATLLGLGALLTGCAHETATSTIRANGSWTRKSVYTMAEPEGLGGKAARSKKVELTDIFSPPSGAGWKVERKTDGEMKKLTITAVKEVGPGETVAGDMTVKATVKKGAAPVCVANSAAVRAAGTGRWAYTETFHWSGPKPVLGKDMAPLVRSSIKKSLPGAMATDANARTLSPLLERALWRALFSPPEPLMLDFYDNLLPITGISDPNERVGVLIRRMGPPIESALFEAFGARMPRDQRHQTAIRLARKIAEDTSAASGQTEKMGATAGKTPGTDNMTESFAGMTPAAITLVVKVPGRVLETNGIVDDLTGEVYWTLYPQAALEQDVTLRAVFEAKPAEQASTR